METGLLPILTVKSRNRPKKNWFSLENTLIINLIISLGINFISILTLGTIESKYKSLCILIHILFMCCLLVLFYILNKFTSKKAKRLSLLNKILIVNYALLVLVYSIMIINLFKGERDKNLIMLCLFSGILSALFHCLFIYSIISLLKQTELKKLKDMDEMQYTDIDKDFKDVLSKSKK